MRVVGTEPEPRFIQKQHKHTAEPGPLSGEVIDGVRVIKIKVSHRSLSPDRIVVKKGEKVKIIVTGAETTKNFVIRGIEVNLVALAGKANTVEFIPAAPGISRIYCSLYCGPGHGYGQLYGTLIVVE